MAEECLKLQRHNKYELSPQHLHCLIGGTFSLASVIHESLVFDGGSDQLKTETYQLAGFHFVINWFFELIAGCTS